MTPSSTTAPAGTAPACGFRRAASFAASALLACVLAAATAVAAAAALGVRPHIEVSDSMRPLLRAGDVLWIDAIRAEDARVGDVVAFAHPDRGDTVLHRVTRVTGTARLAFTTQGDANSGVERWTVAPDGRVGRYAGIRVPAVGRAVRAAQGPPLAIAAALGGLFLAGALLRRIWR